MPSNESLEPVVLDDGSIYIHWPEVPMGGLEAFRINEVERLAPADINLTWAVVNSNSNETETQELGYYVSDDPDVEIDSPNEMETPEIIYLQATDNYDEVENSNGAEQPDKYSNLQENEVSNNAFLLYFIIIGGLNLILICILIILFMLVYIRTIQKSPKVK